MIGDVAWWGALGTAAGVLALVASVADRRRVRRRELDKVGYVPWTAVFFAALLGACVALGFAARAWIAG
jgi:hypothetical protein